MTVVSTGYVIKAARGLWRSAIGGTIGPLADAWIVIRIGDYDFNLHPGEEDIYDLSSFTPEHQEQINNAYAYALNHPNVRYWESWPRTNW